MASTDRSKADEMRPKISIITPTLDQAQYIEETIRSVLAQNYEPLEYIVMDGGSSDETLAVLAKYGDRLAHWESGSDRGQVHALNKGLARATGDIVAYINSDDVYLPGALTAVADYFTARPGCAWVCGDTLMFGEGDVATTLCVADVPRSAGHCLSWAYTAPQPGMFWRRALLNAGFAERWRYCFDHELYVRLLLAGHRCEHLPLPVAGYRLHPTSKTVAEPALFEREFDEISEIYQDRLHGSARRWCKATLLLRRSVAASRAGRGGEAARELLRALTLHPEGLGSRLFWGSVKALLASGGTGKAS